MGTGGSVESYTLDGREFPIAADAEVQIKRGGFENENAMNGNGTARQLKTIVPWSLDGGMVDVDNGRGDHEFLQELSDRFDYFPIAATLNDGTVLQGTGTIIGELQASTQNATAAVNLGGPGKLEKQ